MGRRQVRVKQRVDAEPEDLTDTLLSAISFEVKDSLFLPDYIAALVFGSIVVLELLFLTQVNFSSMLCIPLTVTIDELVNGTTKMSTVDFVELECATDIRWSRMMYYFSKVAVICLSAIILFVCRSFIREINRNSCVLSRQSLDQHLTDSEVEDDLRKYEGFGIAWRTVRDYFRFKAVCVIAFGAVLIPLLVMQFALDTWREIIIPDAMVCNGKAGHFSHDRHVDLQCHLAQEWEVFVIGCVAVVAWIVFYLILAGSLLTTLRFLNDPKNFEVKQAFHDLTPCHVQDEIDIVGIVASFSRIAKETNPDLFRSSFMQFDGITSDGGGNSPPLV